MRKIGVILGIIFVLALAWIVWSPAYFSSRPTTTAPKGTYYCPMHPHYNSDHPGNCPICGMKLIKKEDSSQKSSSTSSEAVPGYAVVSLNEHRQQLIGIKTMKVTRKALIKTIHAYGQVAHDLELYGAQLEYIDAWQQYYAYVLRRQVVADNFREDWWKYYNTSPSQGLWRSTDKLKAQQRLIKAEYELIHMGLTDGEMEKLRAVKQGRPWVQPDLLFFAENHPTWIYAQVLENDLGFIAPTQKVKITIPAYGETMEGIVRNVSLEIDPRTRTTKVRIEVPEYRGELKVNMYVTVDMPVELDEGVVVPREAIMDTGLSKVIFVQEKEREGVFEPRFVQTGFEGDGMVAIKSGLKEGETIVVSGNFLLDSESRLQGALMGESPHD